MKKESIDTKQKPTRQVRKRRIDLGLLGVELEKAAMDLYQPSESDYGYQFFLINAEPQSDKPRVLNAETFLDALGITTHVLNDFGLEIPLEELITETEFEGFFPSCEDIVGEKEDSARLHDLKESKRFRALEKLLKKRLGNVKVFRVGRVIVRCYICGLINDTKIAGLVTTVIET